MRIHVYIVHLKGHKIELGYLVNTIVLCDFILLPTGTSIVLPVSYMGQPTGLLHIYLWRRLCGKSTGEVILITFLGGYVNLEILEITARTVYHQRFELGTLDSQSQGSSTKPSWDLYIKGGDN